MSENRHRAGQAPESAPGHGAAAQIAGSLEKATRGWASRLALWVTVLILFESVTGLWIYLAPFSVSAQLQVLLHTVLGLLFLGPYLYYQVKHWLLWYRQKVTVEMVLGYALLVTILIASVSGIVLTWQAAAGTRISVGWDLVHLVSGIAALAVLLWHVALVFARRLPAARLHKELGVAMRRFARRSVAWTAASVALVAAALAIPTAPAEFPPPPGYTLPEYAQKFDEYRGNPFAPSQARTDTLNLVDPQVLANSDSCGTVRCHEEILAEWEPSAHRFSSMNAPFQAVQRDFAADRNPAETRYCAGCHDPISLFAGAKDIANLDLSVPGVREGASCAVCHAISSVDQRGNADYVVTTPRKYLWESTEGWTKWVSDFLIRSYPRQHLADYDRNLLKTPEFCAGCHKQFIPEALNRFGFVEGQNQYDEWRKGHWHTEDPQTDLACRDCHMRLVADSRDPGRGEGGDVRRTAEDGSHRHHGFIATNSFMPAVLKLPNWERHVALTDEWIRGETVLPEIADVWPQGPVATVAVVAPKEARGGDEVELRVVITNQKAGHNFVTGPLDFVRSWVHLTVKDGEGQVISEWGAIDPETRRIFDRTGQFHQMDAVRTDGTLVLEANPIDGDGEIIKRHELWRKAGGKGKRVIFTQYSDAQTYKFRLPSGVKGPITVEADLDYRRYRQEFLNLVVPTMEDDAGVRQPTVTQASDRQEILIVSAPLPPEAGGAPGGSHR